MTALTISWSIHSYGKNGLDGTCYVREEIGEESISWGPLPNIHVAHRVIRRREKQMRMAIAREMVTTIDPLRVA